jgi:hypothetical protein
MDLVAKSIELRENSQYDGLIYDFERMETAYEMENEILRLRKVVEQATKYMQLRNGAVIVSSPACFGALGGQKTLPDLCAELENQCK